jgi:hypothetical protein
MGKQADDANHTEASGPDQGIRNPAIPGDDTEGQSMHWSNKDLKKDLKPIEPQRPDPDSASVGDTEGQAMHWSNKDLKKDVKPIEGRGSNS